MALLSSPDGGTMLRLIAGDLGGLKGPGSTHTPMTMTHATLSAGARLHLPLRPDLNALASVLSGRGSVGRERRPIAGGQLALFGSGDAMIITAYPTQESRTPELDVLILGGLPIGEPVAWMGPFVMNTHAELSQTFEDYRRGKLGTIPAG